MKISAVWICWVMLYMLSPFCTSASTARIIYVDDDALPGGDGLSWARSYRFLQDALAAAKDGDQICVAQGTYRPDRGTGIASGNRKVMFKPRNGVPLLGGYAGLGRADPDERDIRLYETILSGDLSDNDDLAINLNHLIDHPSREDNSYTVVGTEVDFFESEPYELALVPGLTIDGFTIAAGNANSSIDYSIPDFYPAGFMGGAMYINWPRECFWGPGTYTSQLYCVPIPVTVRNCTFRDNSAQYGGAVAVVQYCDPHFIACTFVNNAAETGGAVYNNFIVQLTRCTIVNNLAQRGAGLANADEWWYSYEWITAALTDCHVMNEYRAKGGEIYLKSTDGRLINGQLIVDGNSRITGCIDIIVGAGNEAIIEGNTTVNLGKGEVCNPGPNEGGAVEANGSLVVQGNAVLQSANVRVNILDVNVPGTIQYNNITLKEASAGFGAEFFVAGSATISCNNIVSEGDRYLDLDPNPVEPNHPTITNNRITVIIKEGKSSNQGTLLELRAGDCDAGGPYNPSGESGAYRVDPDVSHGFTVDPSKNWVLESLVLEANAKLNLTNRQGFHYPKPADLCLSSDVETVYVKEVVMGPNSVLNTGLQTLYYDRLIDPNGHELARDPNDPYALLANHARLVDIPLLGFSLGIIAMNDQTEFDVRVRRRLTDHDDDFRQPPAPAKPLYIGSISRLDPNEHLEVPSGTAGVMEMRTQAPDKESASSVAAKGAFARAGDEEITVEFEYLFLEDPYGEAELVVYLSDHPEVSKRLKEVARIKPPSQGQPGSSGSRQFAVFSGRFSKGNLNFTRGTYVELELRGRNVRCWIDNWDPKIMCGTTKCGDYDNNGVILATDFLLMLAEFGVAGLDRGCLDAIDDGCVSIEDLMVWDSPLLNACPGRTGLASTSSASDRLTLSSRSRRPISGQVLSPESPLLVFGKSTTPTPYPENLVRPCTLQSGLCGLACDGNSIEPPPYSVGNGRLLTGGDGRVYQIIDGSSIVCVDTQKPAIQQMWNVTHPQSGAKVSIGYNDGYRDAYGSGVPLLDAAFDPQEPDVIYVVPVRAVDPDKKTAHFAAARLRRYGSQGDCTVEALYGVHPDREPDQSVTQTGEGRVTGNPDRQHLREIEVDNQGRLYVLSSVILQSPSGQHADHRVLIYAKSGDGQCINEVTLTDEGLTSPAAMVVSSHTNKLYLASLMNTDVGEKGRTTNVFRFSITGDPIGLALDACVKIVGPEPVVSSSCPWKEGFYVSAVTSMTAGPKDGTIYVTGFTAPKFTEQAWNHWNPPGLFTTPMFARINPGTSGTVTASEIVGSPVQLPLSIVWTGLEQSPAGQSPLALAVSGDTDVSSIRYLASRWLTLESGLCE